MSSTNAPPPATSGRAANDPSKVTPPSSINSFPLTPPASEERVRHNYSAVLDLFRLGREYQLKTPWTAVDLKPGDYEQALEELALPDNCELKRFVETKLRHDPFLHLIERRHNG